MINDLCFNQDFTCLSVSTSENHRIFNCDPFGEFYVLPQKASDKHFHGTFLLRMLFSTSLTIIVSGNKEDDRRVLKIFNLKQNLKICELTFPLLIFEVKLNRKRLIVFLELSQIYIYDLSSIRLMKVLDVEPFIKVPGDNKNEPRAIADLSPDDRSLLVLPLLIINDLTDLLHSESTNVCTDPAKHLPLKPEFASGDLNVHPPAGSSLVSYVELSHKSQQSPQGSKPPFALLKDVKNDSGGWVLVYDTLQLKPRLIYKAHDSEIAMIAISSESNYIATASTKGTIVRVSHIEDDISAADNGKLRITQVTNLRRGHNPARINSLKFNLDLSILGCGSESGTIHLFTLDSPVSDQGPETLGEFSHSNDHDEGDLSGEEPGTRLSSLDDLNENLAKLLLLKDTDHDPTKELDKEHGSSYFSALKTSSKLINNQYTKLLMKKFPYKQYLKNLIWEKPRRSFAYVRLPESETGHPAPKYVEISFSNAGRLILASYNSGKLYQYRIPGEVSEEREECLLLVVNNLI